MSEWYEAREDARNEYISEMVHEAENADFDGVADAIESGEFDTEVMERVRVIVQNLGDLDTIRSLKEILGEIKC